jgi:hypothetical protein
MKVAANLALVVALVGLGGCATIVKGTTQDIAVDSNPQGANCTVSRNGAQLAVVNPTPGKIKVTRDREALTFACSKAPEYSNTATSVVESKFNGTTFGNILIGGVVGAVVDASTGSNYSYPDRVMIDLIAANLPISAPPPPITGKPAETAPPAKPTQTPPPEKKPPTSN